MTTTATPPQDLVERERIICDRCGRELSVPVSRERHRGPKCSKYVARAEAAERAAIALRSETDKSR